MDSGFHSEAQPIDAEPEPELPQAEMHTGVELAVPPVATVAEGLPLETIKVGPYDHSSIFRAGLSIQALQALVRGIPDKGIGPAEGNTGECWRQVWSHATLPANWTLEVTAGEGDVTWAKRPDERDKNGVYARRRKYIYRSPSGDEQIDRAPVGSKTIVQLLMDPPRSATSRESDTEADLAKDQAEAEIGRLAALLEVGDAPVGKPTHLVSFPWRMQFRDVVAALANALSRFEGTAYLWMDVLCLGYHNTPDVDTVSLVDIVHNDPSGLLSVPPELFSWQDGGSRQYAGFYSVDTAVQSIGRVVQVLDAWDDPRHLSSLWMMRECFSAIANDTPLTYAMSPDTQRELAASLKEHGPDGILEFLMQLDLDPDKAFISLQRDKPLLIAEMQNDAQRYAGSMVNEEQSMALMKDRVQDLTRKAYTQAVDQEFERQWKQLHLISSADDSAFNRFVTRSLPGVLDLGHQVAALWALTDKQKARKIFEILISKMLQLDRDCVLACEVAGLDKTCAALVQMCSLDEAETRRIQRLSLSGELAVSFQGLSVEFMAKFVQEHDTELNFLSTDAVVERVIKPASKRASVIGPSGKGRAFIETVHEQWKGPPTFFLSHAWRQTFHISGCPWRGGAVQAMVDSVVCESCALQKTVKNMQSMLHFYKTGQQIASTVEPQMIRYYSKDTANCLYCSVKRKDTYVWYDIFCVNQHDTRHAFVFEPLRNAIVQADHVEMFLEKWDDPATLSRVWCIDELRMAMLHGKEVKIIMPQQAMDTFRQRAEDEGVVKTIAEIERIVQRISIEHASATNYEDRQTIFSNIDASVGRPALNQFAQAIMRKALLQAAFPMGVPRSLAATEQHHSQLSNMYADILEIATPKAPDMLQTELLAMKQRALEEKAIGIGVARKAIEATDDAVDPKSEVIQLIQERLADAPQVKTAQKVRILTAVAMMMLREDPRSESFLQGKRHLQAVEQLARKYYGLLSQQVQDIRRQLSRLEDPWYMLLLAHEREHMGKYAVGGILVWYGPLREGEREEYAQTLHELYQHRGHGALLVGVSTETGAQVCLRVSCLDYEGSTHQHEAISMHRRLVHPNIVALVDVINEKPAGISYTEAWERYFVKPRSEHSWQPIGGVGRWCTTTVTEAMAGGPLHDEVIRRGGLLESVARRYLRGILKGVAYLHARNLIHHSITLKNVLLSADLKTAKLTHLEQVRKEERRMNRHFYEDLLKIAGAHHYMPPEGEAYNGFMLDMWMCGVCLYAMTQCRFPFTASKKNDPKEIERKKEQAVYRLHGRSDSYQAFLKRLLCPNIQRRYNALDALRDPWLSEDLAEGEAEADVRAILHDAVKHDDLSITCIRNDDEEEDAF